MKTRLIYITRYLLLTTILLTSVACSKEQTDVATIVDNLWEYSLENPDGFTVEIPDMVTVTNGFAVAYYIDFNNVGKESLTDIVNHALENNNIVGGWLDTDDNVYYFDSIKIFDDSQQEQAEQFAIENQQKAYYDLTNQVTIFPEE
ncbi:MAG: hypothetical protein R3Y22_05705 [Bacteroidales bacterium]